MRFIECNMLRLKLFNTFIRKLEKENLKAKVLFSLSHLQPLPFLIRMLVCAKKKC